VVESQEKQQAETSEDEKSYRMDQSLFEPLTDEQLDILLKEMYNSSHLFTLSVPSLRPSSISVAVLHPSAAADSLPL